MRVIGPDNDAVIAAMLRLSLDGAQWWLEQWQVRERWIDARYRARGGAWAIVRLVALGAAVPGNLPVRATASFRIVGLRSSAGAGIDALLDRLVPQIREHEASFRWLQPRPNAQPALQLEPADVQVERVAFEAGVKPALRLRLDRWEAPYEVALWLRRGAALAVIETDAGSAGEATYVMVARSRAQAEALADAELRQYLPMPAQLDALRECGERLGYPQCCIEAFLRSTAFELGYDDGRDAELDARRCNYLRLDQAWVPKPHPRMNTLRSHEQIGLLSFEPCSLACEAAREVADRIAAAVARVCPEYEQALRGAFAINEQDQRLAIELDEARRVIAARPTRADAEAFAGRIVGRQVDAQGRVVDLAERCRVFVFG